jgi:hypothetical protein
LQIKDVEIGTENKSLKASSRKKRDQKKENKNSKNKDQKEKINIEVNKNELKELE